jgi:lysozyme
MLNVLRRLESLATARKRLPGVDVSSFQGPPGTWKAEAGKIDWAAVKLTELEPNGTRYVNPDAAADWNFLQNNNKGRVAYLFGHPSVSATETVSFFVTQLRKIGLHDGDGVALDLEVTDGRTAAQVSHWADAVTADLHKTLGRPPVVYTFLSFAETGNCAGLGRYPLWIADPSSPAGRPQVPKPWHTWAMHQYDISGSIDRDVANYPSLAAMKKALGKSEPKEPDVKKIGGNIVGALSAGRWENSVTVVAGLGPDGFIHMARWNGEWGPWRKISPTKAKGAPGVLVFGGANGRLFYTDESGTVCVLVTTNSGQTWT